MLRLPSFKSWLKALRLAIPAYAAALVIPLFIYWQFLFISIVLLIEREEVALFFLGVAAITLMLSTLWYLLLIASYSLFLRILWSRPPQWLQLPQSWTTKFLHLGVAAVATLPIAIAYALNTLVIESVEQLTLTDLKALCPPNFILKLTWIWIIAAAYLYQWKTLANRTKKI